MFDDIPDPATCGELTPAEIVSAIRQCHRTEAASAGRKWAFTHMLLRAREDAAAAEEQTWAHDTWAAVKDEIGAAMSLSPRRASGQIRIAEALAERLPKVAELLAHGIISAKVAATIVYRTEYVAHEAQATVDAEIAQRAGGFGTLAEAELDLTIDAVIEERDPDACRRFREAATGCDVGFGKLDDATGTQSVYGRILATDGDVATKVLNAMAATVCRDDPRSRGQLRAAAFGAFFHGCDRLVCQCGNPDCAAAALPSKVGKVVVHILAEQATLAAALAEAAAYAEQQRAERARHHPAPEPEVPEPAASSTDDDEPPWARACATEAASGTEAADQAPCDADPALTSDTTSDTATDASKRQAQCAAPQNPPADTEPGPAQPGPAQPDQPGPGEPRAATTPPTPPVPAAVTTAGHIIPTPLLAELIRTGVATLTPLTPPDDTPEPHYTPSQRLRRTVLCRDILCRFPGCNRRADYADIDHTIPDADGGATHPSNTKVLCREHHLAKTFRGGPTGWRDEQLPDGAVIWTAPTGHSYLTEPTSILIFPDQDTTTAPLPPPTPTKRQTSDPGITMPKRQRTRAQDREQHIKAERKYNATQRALENAKQERPPPPRLR